jgi:hypothetical protein
VRETPPVIVILRSTSPLPRKIILASKTPQRTPLNCPQSFLTMPLQTPPFSSLPLKKDGPRGNAWGLFGPTDELGMLNRLTPETTLAASKEIVHGVRVCTDWALDQPKVPGFERAKFEHTIKQKHPRTVNDDEVKFNTQSSTQWDGFRHFGE